MTEMEEREPNIPETGIPESENMELERSVEDQPPVGYESAPGDDVDEAGRAPEKKPALTIVVQSWATPLVGILMLVVGLLGGYFGRPLLMRETAVLKPQASTASATSVSAQSPETGELMRVVSEQTRHFIGSEDAPVTIIEFSDFQ